MSESEQSVSEGRLRLVSALRDGAEHHLGEIADVEVRLPQAGEADYSVSSTDTIVTLRFDASLARLRFGESASPGERGSWSALSAERCCSAVAGLLSSGIYHVCWPSLRDGESDLEAALVNLPLPAVDAGLITQLAVLVHRYAEVVDARRVEALRGALDRVVAELYSLDLDTLMLYEWDV